MCMGGVGGGWVGWLVGWRAEGGKGGVYGGGGVGRLLGKVGGVVQFRRPLSGLENSGIVPAGMQHQQ